MDNHFFMMGILFLGIFQLEAKETAWRAEWNDRLVKERAELERQLNEERAARCQAAETAVSSMADERRTWQQQIDVLLEKTRYLLAEKERLEKNIRQEVDTQVQVHTPKKQKKKKTINFWPFFGENLRPLFRSSISNKVDATGHLKIPYEVVRLLFLLSMNGKSIFLCFMSRPQCTNTTNYKRRRRRCRPSAISAVKKLVHCATNSQR